MFYNIFLRNDDGRGRLVGRAQRLHDVYSLDTNLKFSFTCDHFTKEREIELKERQDNKNYFQNATFN